MRSKRYKQWFPQDGISFHNVGGWSYKAYPIKYGKGDTCFYKVKHDDWYMYINRIWFRFENKYDEDNLVFSNLVPYKYRCGIKYDMVR